MKFNTSVIFDTDLFDIHLIYILLRIIVQILKQALMSFVLFQNGGLTSLMYAADGGHLEVTRLLILIGCDKEATTVCSIISDQFDQILLKCIEKKLCCSSDRFISVKWAYFKTFNIF